GADGGAEGFAGVVSLLGAAPDGGAADRDAPAALVGAAAATAVLVQALGDAGVEAPLWCVTAGAVSVTGEDLAGAVGAGVWGLGRVIGLEHPRRWGGLVDLPAVPDGRALAALAGVLAAGGAEDEIAVRPLGTFARRLARPSADRADRPAAAWRTSGTALVTGGTGALGAHTARWLAAHGATRVLLLGRR
ncbi:KR domain-containing protein, partial [Streptomyces sp. B1866]|uniref:KR domain-containing protein n=1 Tax=Streptomyces sp. B1866 TaxID=3075431 RepID=UPI00289143D0